LWAREKKRGKRGLNCTNATESRRGGTPWLRKLCKNWGGRSKQMGTKIGEFEQETKKTAGSKAKTLIWPPHVREVERKEEQTSLALIVCGQRGTHSYKKKRGNSGNRGVWGEPSLLSEKRSRMVEDRGTRKNTFAIKPRKNIQQATGRLRTFQGGGLENRNGK